MALTFRKVTRKIIGGEEKDTYKVFATAKSKGTARLPRLSELISERSSVSSADVKSVLDSLVWSIGMELKEGKSVVLDDLGAFRLTIKSTGTPTEEEFTANCIRSVRIVFTPSPKLRKVCDDVKFEQESVREKIVEKECDKEHLE